MTDSTPPPPSSGGGAKYAIIGVLLFLIAGAVYWLTSTPETPAPPPQAAGEPDAGAPARSTALAEADLEIPELEPDAGPPPDAGVAAPTKRASSGPARSWDECSGDIAPDAARRVIAEYNTQIRNCYERQLKTNPGLEGNMQLSIRVAADGRVDGTQVSGTLRDRDVFACVRGVTSHMRFPAPGGRDCALVQVPFNFTPRR